MVQQLKAVYSRNKSINIRAYPISIILQRMLNGLIAILFPTFIYYYVFKGNISEEFIRYTGSDDYITFIVLGNCANALAVTTLIAVSRSLIEEIREGTIDALIMSPAYRLFYFMGYYMEQFKNSLFELGIVLVVGTAIGGVINIHITAIFQLCYGIVLISIASFSISIIMADIMVYTRDTYITQNTFFILIQIICGINFPPEYLPTALQEVSRIIPLSSAIKILRMYMDNKIEIKKLLCLSIDVILLSMIYIILGIYWSKRLDKRIIEDVMS